MSADTAAAEEKAPLGRPSVYSKEKADFILGLLADGKSLRFICDTEQGQAFVPPLKPSTIRWWVVDDVDGFAAQYARARDIGLDAVADELFDIADDGSNDLMTIEKGDTSYEMENKEVTNRSKLRVETRKWYLSKLAPKRYGDKLDVTHKGDEECPVEFTVKIDNS
ncbi:hypothetical protein ELG77_08930 [Rhizobium leguminosarum]|uniref:terminase small subunit-like protein n=1 Tax=Rhizobium leguminosarum TaxID=384 RepID=UPI001031B039|nr:hypothetical protein [Rhizobium leguminosarum]TBG41885.1 hypothetical protein ELG77_08930 [Rhizobium leguminosarum]